MLWLIVVLVLVAGALIWNTLETRALHRVLDTYTAVLREWLAALQTLGGCP